MSKRPRSLVFSVAILLAAGLPSTAVAQESGESNSSPTVNVEFVLDSSGSMAGVTDVGEIRMDAAKRVLHEVVASIPDRAGRINIGFRVYGQEGDNTEATKDASC